jgi:predicted DCC family thiol-disulfide oxidoreductase YuxK
MLIRMAEPAALPPHIVLYDGVCGLCSRSVRFLIRRDRDRRLRFAPLQGDTAAGLRARFPEIPETLESVVLVDGDRVYLRSKAFLYTARFLTRPWRWAWHLRWLPAFVLDLGYRLIARVRYRIWGEHDACEIPAPKERDRFLP